MVGKALVGLTACGGKALVGLNAYGGKALVGLTACGGKGFGRSNCMWWEGLW